MAGRCCVKRSSIAFAKSQLTMIGLFFASGASSSSSSPSNSHGNHATKWHLVTRLLGLPLQLRITGTSRQGFDPQQGHAVTPRTRPLSRLLSPAIHQPGNRFTVQKLWDVLQKTVAHPVVVFFHNEDDPSGQAGVVCKPT